MTRESEAFCTAWGGNDEQQLAHLILKAESWPMTHGSVCHGLLPCSTSSLLHNCRQASSSRKKVQCKRHCVSWEGVVLAHPQLRKCGWILSTERAPARLGHGLVKIESEWPKDWVDWVRNSLGSGPNLLGGEIALYCQSQMSHVASDTCCGRSRSDSAEEACQRVYRLGCKDSCSLGREGL